MSRLAIAIADTSQHALARLALERSLALTHADEVLVYSDRPWPGHAVRTIAPITSMGQYNRLVTQRLAEDLTADHVLVVQYDGFVLNGDEWSPHFRHYDYIGAPWPHLPDTPVGNGGFSLRSRRLVEAVARLPYDGDGEAEDLYICRTLRRRLESAHAIRYAPAAIASHFAVESMPVPHPTFGFHGVFHLPAVYRAQPLALLAQLPDAVLARWQRLLRPAFAAVSAGALAAFDDRLAPCTAR